MAPMAVIGMVFVLILVAMVGGFILLMPLSRRLGQLLDVWLLEGKSATVPEEVMELRRLVEALEQEVAALSEKQQFTDRLLEGRRGAQPGPSRDPSSSAA